MGLLKRIIRRSTSKLLTAVGGQRHSQRLVLNSTGPNSVIQAQRQQDASSIFAHNTSTTFAKTSGKMHSRKSRSSSNRKQQKKSSREAALLLAAKNHLPPVQFHHVHGKTAQLSEDYFVARRSSTFCQAIVFSNRIILPNERVYIKVLELAKGWSGTIRFGFTSVDPATLRVKMPKHVCPDMTNAGHTWARALADEVVRKNSIIHFSYDKQGFIHYGINNQDCGIFCANVNTSQHLWFVVDVYGLTAAVELIDPRASSTAAATANASLDLSNLSDDELHAMTLAEQHPIYKATGASIPGGRSRRSTAASRSSFRRRFGAAPRSQASHFLADHLKFGGAGRHRLAPQPGDYLPNIHSAMFPITQQNIYSPMPTSNNIMMNNSSNLTTRQHQQERQAHDYHQIMSNQQQQQQNLYSAYTDSNYHYYRQQQQVLQPPSTLTTANASPTSIDSDQSAATSSNLRSNLPTSLPNASPTQRAAHSTTPSRRSASATTKPSRLATISDEHHQEQQQQQICHQLNGLQLSATSDINGQQSKSTASGISTSGSSSSSVAPTNGLPVAATRKRLQNVTNTSTSASASKTKASAGSSQATNKSSKTKNSKSISTAARDNNQNQPPPTKDCPICFERPINCVLYQCGHMCTCYECGVKQWRTQSRTCPICRTVIKDVIKTYMS